MSLFVLENDALRVIVNPAVGGTVTSVQHKRTGMQVLGEVPWETIDAPLDSLAARDEPEWLTRYTGGWPLLFPNAGDACEVDGVFHGFHGEASVAPWDVIETGPRLVLARRFTTAPARMERSFTLEADCLIIAETLSAEGMAEVIWGHHPTFGSGLLAGPVEITSGAREVTIEPSYAAPAGSDLFHPKAPLASVVYLQNFDQPWAAIRRLDDAIAVHLSWDGERFPCAWLWHELEATSAAPWSGRTRLIGIEPNTTTCALGLAEARRRGAPLLRLEPGTQITSHISLRVFKPQGPINSNLT